MFWFLRPVDFFLVLFVPPPLFLFPFRVPSFRSPSPLSAVFLFALLRLWSCLCPCPCLCFPFFLRPRFLLPVSRLSCPFPFVCSSSRLSPSVAVFGFVSRPSLFLVALRFLRSVLVCSATPVDAGNTQKL